MLKNQMFSDHKSLQSIYKREENTEAFTAASSRGEREEKQTDRSLRSQTGLVWSRPVHLPSGENITLH